MSTKVLPDKLSDLLELALADLEKAEADPYAEIDMGEWMNDDGERCLVCLAGSVMRYSIHACRRGLTGPCEFGDEIEMKLLALNRLRLGQIDRACDIMGVRPQIQKDS